MADDVRWLAGRGSPRQEIGLPDWAKRPWPEVAEYIRRLKEEQDAIILAHNYQRPEVQDVADIVGDSLALARAGAASDAPVIALCGVQFMAESAAILSPEKQFEAMSEDAICGFMKMITLEKVRDSLRDMQYPVTVAPDIAARARRALERMVVLG